MLSIVNKKLGGNFWERQMGLSFFLVTGLWFLTCLVF